MMKNCESCSYAVLEDGVYTCPYGTCIANQPNKKEPIRKKVQAVLNKLLDKFKAKEHVSKEEYESALQEDLRNKNFIVSDGLAVMKAFVKQEMSNEPVLNRSRTQGQNYGYQGNNNQRQGYYAPQQDSTQRQGVKSKFPEMSIKELMDKVRNQQ
jgi:hypothetical protein